MKKKLLIALVLLLIAAAVAWKTLPIFASPDDVQSADDAPKVVAVKKDKLVVTVEATGRVVPAREVEIKCKASGEIIALPVDVSDRVKKNDLLLQLDPENEERSVKRAEVALTISEARLAQAKTRLEVAKLEIITERKRAEANVASAAARLEEAESRIKRLQELSKTGLSTLSELDTANTAMAQARADVKLAEAQSSALDTRETELATLQEEIGVTEAQVRADALSLSDANQRLTDTTILSPVDGVVATNNVQAGQIVASGINTVSGGTAVMTLADLSRTFVLVAVDESDIGSVELGQKSRVAVDAYPGVFFGGEVVRIATKGVNVSNVVTFEVKVEVKGKNRDLLKPEMTANVSITTIDRAEALLIPATAVERRKLEQFVTMAGSGAESEAGADGANEKRRVTIGANDGEFVEVTGGLAEGEKILVPSGDSQSRWRQGEDGGANARNDMRRMRMMGGGGGRR